MTSLDEALRALEKDCREYARMSDHEHMKNVAEDFREVAGRLQDILSARQEVAPVADAMTLSAPPKLWLQIDPDALEDSEREAIPRDCWDQLTWCAESVGGHEVRYVREDLASPAHTSEARDSAVMKLLDERIAAETNKTRRWALICFRDAAMRQEGGTP